MPPNNLPLDDGLAIQGQGIFEAPSRGPGRRQGGPGRNEQGFFGVEPDGFALTHEFLRRGAAVGDDEAAQGSPPGRRLAQAAPCPGASALLPTGRICVVLWRQTRE